MTSTRRWRIDRTVVAFQGNLMPIVAARHRRALTLIDVVAVIVVVAILIALLIPAIQRSRETAARAECTHNLKLIGDALDRYVTENKSFPAGYVSKVDDRGHETGPGWGWASLILASGGHGDLAQGIRFAESIASPTNAKPRVAVLRPYRCPSNRSAPPTWTARRFDAEGKPAADICDIAFANYVGVFGIGQPGSDGDGVFYRNSAIRPDDIRDGKASTMIVGERASSLALATWTGAVAEAKLFPANSASFILGHTGGMANPATPSEVNNFSSDHPGGVNYLFADGHVKFLTASMSPAHFQALSTRAGREQIHAGD
jgi:prepilin-type processing-associated H-X9-DG protein